MSSLSLTIETADSRSAEKRLIRGEGLKCGRKRSMFRRENLGHCPTPEAAYALRAPCSDFHNGIMGHCTSAQKGVAFGAVKSRLISH